MAVELTKKDPNCINFELIDSTECLADSLPKINKVFLTSKSAQQEMVSWLTDQRAFVSTFNAISAKMVVAALNIQQINNTFRSPYTTIQILSSQWNKKEFSIYYPTLIDIVEYNSSSVFYRSIFLTWMNFYFPPERYPIGQEVSFFVSLIYTNRFDFIFEGGYLESCSPTARSGQNTLSCNGCGGDNRYAFCNIRGRACGNAYRFCTTSTVRDSETFNCRGTVGTTVVYDSYFDPPNYSPGNTGLLSIKYRVLNIEDMFLSRVIKIKMRIGNLNDSVFWEVVN